MTPRGRPDRRRRHGSILALVLALLLGTASTCTSGGGADGGVVGDVGDAREHDATVVAAEPPRVDGTVVSLTFDQGTVSQYRWARPLLREAGLNATFYLTTGRLDVGAACCMTWPQAQTLYREGDEIGASTEDGRDLTTPFTPDPEQDHTEKERRICRAHDRLAELGLDPRSFAYPAGAHVFDFPIRSRDLHDLVASCGYLSARIVGGLSSTGRPSSVPSMPLPPADPFVVRTPDEESTTALTLAELQGAVTAVSDASGHWVPLVFAEVCHEGEPSYRDCMATRRPVDDRVLAAFLSWLRDAGQPGGAPADVAVRTVRQVVGAPAPPPLAGPRTVVTLTFDDADVTHALAGALLRRYGLHGTFYVNSGPVDAENRQHMTWAQIIRLRQDGNDIGGHTVDHRDLTDPELDDAARREEVCGDRRRLQQMGMDPVSFAYPYGAIDEATQRLVDECGYRSGRSSGGISEEDPAPETVPPGNPLATRALRSPDGPWTLERLQRAVTATANGGGGWLQVPFHRVCAGTGTPGCMSGTSPVDGATFVAFLDWLADDAPEGTTVQTVREVMVTSR